MNFFQVRLLGRILNIIFIISIKTSHYYFLTTARKVVPIKAYKVYKRFRIGHSKDIKPLILLRFYDEWELMSVCSFSTVVTNRYIYSCDSRLMN